MKIHPVGGELFHADGRTEGRTDMAKLRVLFHNFANAPKIIEDPRTSEMSATSLPFSYVPRSKVEGFGGLVVSMLASGTQVCGFKPGRSRWIFTGVKILSMPSSGWEVKVSVPCPSFAACKRT